MAYITFTCWSIWKARCEAVFNSRQPSPGRTILAVSMVVSSFIEANSGIGNSQGLLNVVPYVPSQWSPPANGVLKVNVDANWKGISRGCHIGVVIGDFACRCLVVRRKEIRASSALVAEAKGILEGCRTVKR